MFENMSRFGRLFMKMVMRLAQKEVNILLNSTSKWHS